MSVPDDLPPKPQKPIRKKRGPSAVILGILGAIAKLALLAAILLGTYFLAFAARSHAITVLDRFSPAEPWYLVPGYWLNLGHLAVMAALFVSILTNRVLGPAYAFGQCVVAWAVLAGVYLGFSDMLGGFLPKDRAFTAFLIALAAAHIGSILAFDQTRGKPWWRAPLYGALTFALVLPILYWLIAKWRIEPFVNRMVVDAALKSAIAVALLLPYALLRPVLRPRGGFGGY